MCRPNRAPLMWRRAFAGMFLDGLRRTRTQPTGRRIFSALYLRPKGRKIFSATCLKCLPQTHIMMPQPTMATHLMTRMMNTSRVSHVNARRAVLFGPRLMRGTMSITILHLLVSISPTFTDRRDLLRQVKYKC
mgnify:CR=1 FL=1